MNKPLTIAVTTADLLGLLSGYGIAVIMLLMPVLSMEFSLTPQSKGLIFHSTMAGALLSALFSGRAGDYLGRKYMMQVMVLFFLFSSIASAVVSSLTFFLVFRFCVGAAIGGAFVIVPVYIGELSPPAKRGRLVASFQLTVIAGFLMAFILDYFLFPSSTNHWRFMFLAGVFPAVLFFLFKIFLPESPRYLLMRGLEHETDIVLRRVSPEVDRQSFIQDFKKSVNIEILLDNAVLFKKTYGKLIFMGILVGYFFQFTGIGVVAYYSEDLFRSIQIRQYPELHGMVIGVTAFILTLITMFMVDKVGRTRLLLSGSAGMGVSLAIATVLASTGLMGSFLMALVLLLFIAFFALSQGTLMWILLSEIFPNNIRMRGVSFSFVSFWIFGIGTYFILPMLTNYIGIAFLLGLSAVTTCVSYFFFRYYFTGTKGKSLEEIEIMMTEREKSGYRA